MKGMREILVSFAVALATLGTYAYLKQKVETAERRQNDAEPTQAAIAPDDAAISLNWGTEAVSAPLAWQKQTGSKKIVVAIIDTGCDPLHPALAENIWRNPGESGLDEYGQPKASNGIDDDDNGFVDDVQGWNFADNSPVIMDEHGHGTHIAGIIGARMGNGFPVHGVSPDVSLMILKYYDSKISGSANLENTIRAIRYAVRMGANIINYSGGGILRSQAEEDTLKWAAEQGVLVVAAAGNEGMNSDFFHFYPADYELPNILSVAAVDRDRKLMSLSNFGLHTVDVAAPGKNIYSTLPGGTYGYMSGTSQATAFVTGVAALLMAQDSRMQDPRQVIRQISGYGRPETHLKAKIKSGSIVNAKASLDALDLSLAGLRKPAENRDN